MKTNGCIPLKPTKDDRFMFNLIANNHKVISTSQTYASIDNVKIGIEGVASHAPDAEIVMDEEPEEEEE